MLNDLQDEQFKKENADLIWQSLFRDMSVVGKQFVSLFKYAIPL